MRAAPKPKHVNDTKTQDKKEKTIRRIKEAKKLGVSNPNMSLEFIVGNRAYTNDG